MVVHQGLAYIPTATGGGGGAGSPWVGAVITVGLLISPVALPHLSRRLKTLMASKMLTMPGSWKQSLCVLQRQRQARGLVYRLYIGEM